MKEIVHYDEMHTMMYQLVTVYVDPKVCKEMLEEDLNDISKRELLQAYYLVQLKNGVDISEKNHYGAWNASISDLSAIEPYLERIVAKLKGHLNQEDVETNFTIVNEITGLSEYEVCQAQELLNSIAATFNISYKSTKPFKI